ncbi:dihydrolipoamide acetyltransferase family protein [Nioella ostreopsis]|uniref:dihydrolipoamide acetyltransferase family protein n=1 Tax=Nioella ostreopsis TaxID=2448479 RepID=UPI000FD8FF98|nr:dihydrolipoamide acetyltransferase family protein [Nioella ostreopsis]
MGIFAMPSLGADMEAGRLIEWLVSPGDAVTRGDIVAVVETQKGAIEIECFEEGTVRELLADIGTDLAVGAPLATIQAEGEPIPEAAVAEQATPVEAEQPVVTAPAPQPVAPIPPQRPQAPAPGVVQSSPAARIKARELGFDLAMLTGSGPGGAIVLEDVEAEKTPQSKRSPQDEMRRAIAAAMTRSKQTIPHFYLSQTIDVTPAMEWLTSFNEGKPPSERVLLGALFLRATVLASAKVKTVNGHFTEEGFKPSDKINPGLAVALRSGGLVAPAIVDAEQMGIVELMAAMRDLVTRARAGRLRSSEMTEGTITLSSLGDSGAESMAGVIFPPQVALVGIGAPGLRPWVVDGNVEPRHLVTLTISADHRANDGRQASRFLSVFDSLLSTPEAL